MKTKQQNVEIGLTQHRNEKPYRESKPEIRNVPPPPIRKPIEPKTAPPPDWKPAREKGK